MILDVRLRVALITLAPSEESPRHHHSSITEKVICVRGAVVLHVDQPDASVELGPGEWREVPPGMKHALSNPQSTPSTYLLVQQGNYDFVESAA